MSWIKATYQDLTTRLACGKRMTFRLVYPTVESLVFVTTPTATAEFKMFGSKSSTQIGRVLK